MKVQTKLYIQRALRVEEAASCDSNSMAPGRTLRVCILGVRVQVSVPCL